ncbi:hypothetical protein CVT26_005808 [Gymnopilus dilepis]|uniref:Uncharacterized protein n=1 Tax=Gymnopilus dilepis TaxID=231916 RepID=A0A409WG04_9AGAR|nr:hypothetical protein CVT26_005808 [Gymnopilus dilepis]
MVWEAQQRDGGGYFSFLSTTPPSISLAKSESEVGYLVSKAQPKAFAVAVITTSLGKTSRRRGRGLNSAHRLSLSSAKPHFPRIEERVGGGGSALWCPAGVAATPILSACHQAVRVGCMLALMPGCPPCSQFDDLELWLVLSHPATANEIDVYGIASWLTPRVPRLRDRVGREHLGWALSRDSPQLYPPFLRIRGSNGPPVSQGIELVGGYEGASPSATP